MSRSVTRDLAATTITILVLSTSRMAAAEKTVPRAFCDGLEAVVSDPDATVIDAGPRNSPDSAYAAQSSPADSVRSPGTGARAKRVVRNFLSDGWHVASSPVRVRGTGFIWAGAILGMEAILFANDQEVLDAVVRNRKEPLFKGVVDLGTRIEPIGFMGRTNPIYLGALAAGYAFNIRALRSIPTQILESHLLAGGVRNLGKVIVGRRHPYENAGPYEFVFGEGTSFPSGHTSVAFELATIASMNAHALPVTIAAYSLATTLAIQRIESLNHWPSDVFISATYGTLVARTVVELNEQREKKGEQGLSILPELSDDGRWVGIRFTRTF